jgi:hypothetical protein
LEEFAQRGQFGRRRTGQGLGGGDDPVQAAEQHGERGALSLAVAIPLVIAFGPFNHRGMVGRFALGLLQGLGAFGGLGPDDIVGTRHHRPHSALAVQPKLQRNAEADRGEAAVKEMEELDPPRMGLRLLGLASEHLAQAERRPGQLVEQVAARIDGAHENKDRTFAAFVKGVCASGLARKSVSTSSPPRSERERAG